VAAAKVAAAAATNSKFYPSLFKNQRSLELRWFFV
jgi:hypothetical protein